MRELSKKEQKEISGGLLPLAPLVPIVARIAVGWAFASLYNRAY